MADLVWTINDSVPVSLSMEFVPSDVTATFSGELPFLEVTPWVAHTNNNIISVELPMLTGSFSVLTGEIATFDSELPFLSSSFQGYSEILAQFLGIILPKITSSFTALSGVISTFSSDLPLATANFLASQPNIATFAVSLPFIYCSFDAKVIPITISRKAIVMHLFSHSVTNYVNFNFNSLAHFGEVFLGANEQGLYILGGKDDLGQAIQADIRTGIQDFASDGVMKLPKEAWMVYRTDGQLELDVEVEENKDPYSYIFEKTSRKITEARETLGKGLDERFYTFVIKNNGSDFDLQSIRILGNIIQRKRR